MLILIKSCDPLRLVFCMLFIRCIITSITYIIVNKWIRLTVLIFFIGGIIVIFIYIVAIRTQVVHFGASKNFFFFTVPFIAFMIRNWVFPFKQTSFVIELLYHPSNSYFLLVLVLILLLTLIFVSFIAKNWTGPIKTKLYD